MSKPEKTTVVLESDVREELEQWALEEGRPLSNLLRRIVHAAIERRAAEQQREMEAAA
jgi:hypothetical protein